MQLTTVQLKDKINNIKTFNSTLKDNHVFNIKNDLQFIERIFSRLSTEIDNNDLKSVANNIIDIAIAISQAERGLLYIKNDKRYELIAARNSECQSINIAQTDFSRNILFKAMELKQLVQIINKELLSENINLNNLRLHFIMCSPMVINEDNIGAIYVDSTKPLRKAFRFTPEYFSLFANKAAVFIRNTQYYQHIREHDMQLRLINEQLEKLHAMAAKGKNAAKIGHELNNLLAGIYGNIDITRSLICKNKEVEQILERLKKVEDLLRNIDRFSKSLLNNSKFECHFKPMTLNQVIQDFLRQYSSLYKGLNVSFDINLDSELPNTKIDQGLIQQVILNLVKNSIEVKPDCRILFKTLFDKKLQSINFYFADNGPGMSAEKLAHVFKKNYTDKPEGNGYGLMICKEIIEKHGGTISVQSKPGKGMIFIITLPLMLSENKVQTPKNQLDMIYNSWI